MYLHNFEKDKKEILYMESVDARHKKFFVRLFSGIFTVLFFLNSIMLFVDYLEDARVFFSLWAISASIFFGFWACVALPRLVSLYKTRSRSGTFPVFETELSVFRVCGRSFCFEVTWTDDEGKTCTGSTDPLYGPGNWVADFEMWNGKKVLAAYDPKKEKVYVLSLADAGT